MLGDIERGMLVCAGSGGGVRGLVVRSRRSKKDKQYNEKRNKKTNNGRQDPKQKSKD